MKNYIHNDPTVALAQFELLRKDAQQNLNSTPEFESALAIYEELCNLQQTLILKEIALRNEAFKMPVS